MSINLFRLASECLFETDPFVKVSKTYDAYELIQCSLELNIDNVELGDINEPGRPEKPILISPRNLPRRSMASSEGQGALIHAICHIEFNAINLAWDIIVRFKDMPLEFYQDWMRVAYEEAQHFSMLVKCLEKRQYVYGDFNAHNGLWDAAIQTRDDILRRLAIVPRVHEAHGLDVTPDILLKVKSQSTMSDVVEALEIILREEVGHVQAGTKWFNYVCEKRNLDPLEEFSKLIDEFNIRQRTKNMNISARLKAGFTEAELELLQ